jgi:hypothetical protein
MSRLLVPLILLATLVPGATARAEPFPVTNADDSGSGSLRAAIGAANARSGADTIPITATGTIHLASALPAISDDVDVVGPGAGSLTIERGGASGFRILDFADGVTASLSGLTISGGIAPRGAGIRNGNGNLTLTRVAVEGNEALAEGAPTVEAEGGGVLSEGWLTMRQSVVRDNRASAVGGGTLNSALGGGIAAAGPVLLTRSTISGNSAEAHGEGGKQSKALGGGLLLTGGPAFVELSTISGNSVVADTSLTNEARGGGMQATELSLTSSTVTANSLTSIGFAAGANLELEGTTHVGDTIVADPLGDAESCGEPAGSSGFNLDEDGSCGLTESSDLVGVAAGLDPVLRDNGGPTPTHALQANSPAVDRGTSFGLTIDQRGFPRPSDFPAIGNKEGGDGSDIGAFELQVPAVPAAGGGPVVVSERATDRSPPQTRIVSGPPRVTYKAEARFRFASTEAQSHFQCKLDRKKRWRACANPFERSVKPGRHLFRVRAIDRFGNVDPTPARFGWRVKPIV